MGLPSLERAYGSEEQRTAWDCAPAERPFASGRRFGRSPRDKADGRLESAGRSDAVTVTPHWPRTYLRLAGLLKLDAVLYSSVDMPGRSPQTESPADPRAKSGAEWALSSLAHHDHDHDHDLQEARSPGSGGGSIQHYFFAGVLVGDDIERGSYLSSNILTRMLHSAWPGYHLGWFRLLQEGCLCRRRNQDSQTFASSCGGEGEGERLRRGPLPLGLAERSLVCLPPRSGTFFWCLVFRPSRGPPRALSLLWPGSLVGRPLVPLSLQPEVLGSPFHLREVAKDRPPQRQIHSECSSDALYLLFMERAKRERERWRHRKSPLE